MLLFQVGDFYEFFGDDARRAAHLLNLALTRKTKKAQVHALNEMCGFPIGSVDSFVEKLVMHHGVKVAICNQTESASSAKKRGYNALVDRQVVRIVTPGSLVEDTMLTPEENNYLASLFYDEEKWGLAWADLSTGEFVSTTSTSDKLASAILRCSPKEILLPSIHVEASPLMNLELLERRLDAVSYFFGQEQLLQRTRKQLAEMFDMERNLQRLSIGAGTPKDLKNVASTIEEAKQLVELIQSHERSRHTSDQQREDIVKAAEEIHAALKDDYASLNSKSGFVRAGYSPELDKWQAILRHDPKSPEKQELQAKYRELLGSTRLRVVFQAEKGYFLDLPHEENAKLLKTDRGRQELEKLTMFQSLKNSVRYRSEELRQMNRELTEAAVEVERVENAIFALLRDRVLIVRGELQSMAHAISQIDIVCSHAQVALDRNFTRPLLDGSRELHIEDGRHAVVEAAHLRGSNSRGMRAFVPNSLHLAAVPIGSCWLLTGPNMGGKSTFLRQNAHLVVLAQMGSFVPAKFVRVGLVDKLFCRVGSADDLAADKSTFMVEMQETSTILTQATSRSLVLMDEVGRGTAVNDGVAIAGAVLESLCTKQTRTLFATHFTVLNELVGETCGGELQPYRMEVLEHQVSGQTKQLVFSHRVVKGLATQSYGINTAALAGCPPTVVARATELLVQLAGDCEDNNGLTQTDEHQQECKEDNEVSNS
ncbi:hypothetical protein BBO99_00008654 [Phytophthora kernoviae]|uniref:DNA mismatch repair proteins mutS family domain-containing protein n=1 Tax=Phytophthora kernoviae TaxID=325452 RepID=A0A3R7G1F1_9STRA|nr:hypothetical protein JM16_007943 [Phytophthora kernoviae]RLN14597.1 hypothetical protein BBI17_008142 [Phytophthora kernoviae]RLN74937.1 hypothetical protein BBO99_00008654 [Phytophthora kernoviae]